MIKIDGILSPGLQQFTLVAVNLISSLQSLLGFGWKLSTQMSKETSKYGPMLGSVATSRFAVIGSDLSPEHGIGMMSPTNSDHFLPLTDAVSRSETVMEEPEK